MKQGIYYHKEKLQMVEFAWVCENKIIAMVWTYQDMKSGRGIISPIPLKQFKIRFKYLGEV